MESNTFLQDLQTCVMEIKGSFMGNTVQSPSGSVKKRGMRTKISLGSRFMGCWSDSREQSFGKTFVCKELLTAVI